jgi:hypothetical protein
MVEKRRLVRLIGACVGLWLTATSCHSDDGEARGLSTEECSDACAKIAAADCGDVGSGCVDQCVHGPVLSVSASAGDCARVESAYFNCFWGAASYVCDARVGTLPVGCDDERSALQTCEGGAAGNEGGTGGAAGNEGGAAGGAGAAGAAAGAAGGAGGAP